MDKLLAIRMFLRTAQLGSLARAGDELGVSRSMVSKHIAGLENELGARLLNRTTRKVSLTEAGTLYRDSCVQILAELDEAEGLVSRARLEPSGRLRIAAPPSFGLFHVTPAVSDYMQQHPQVDVSLTLIDRTPDLVDEGYDLAIRLGELEDSSLVAHPIAHSRMVVCGAPSYFARHGRPTCPQDLAAHNCLQLNYRPLQYGNWIFQSPSGTVEVPVHGNFESNIGDVLRAAAVAGTGLVLQPSYMVAADIADGLLEPVQFEEEPLGVDVHVVYLHRKHLSAKVSSFVAFLRQRYAGEPYWEAWRGQMRTGNRS